MATATTTTTTTTPAQASNKPGKGASNKPGKGASNKPAPAPVATATGKAPAPFGTRGAAPGQGAAQAPVPTGGLWGTVVVAHPKLAQHAKPGSINAYYAQHAAKPITLAALHAAIAINPQYKATARATNPANLRTRVLQAYTVYGVLVAQGPGASTPPYAGPGAK